jgi:Fe-S-cluster containining protein
MTSDVDAEKNPVEKVFTCNQCGDCCIGYGGTYVTGQDLERISAFIGINPQTFVKKFCCLSGDRQVLTQKEDGHCVFWDKICTIHSVKPRMCREWPYIESLLVDFDNWKAMASMCPGIKKDASPRIVKTRLKKTIFHR